MDSRQMQALSPPKIIVPGVVEEGLRRVLDAHSAMDGCSYDCDIRPCTAEDEVALSPSLTVRPFPTRHTLPSQGYVLSRSVRKLKPEYRGLSGEELKRLKTAGREIQDAHHVAEVAFTGDTTIDFLESESAESALQAKLLIVELTYLDNTSSPEQAKIRGHMHIRDFIQNADRFKNEHILLIHLSARYSKNAALKLLNEQLPPGLKAKCSVLLEGFH